MTPVRKFRSGAEMPGPPPLTPLQVDNLRAAFALAGLAYGLRPWRFPAGLRKFRSVDDAARWRRDWERANRVQGRAGRG